MAAVLAIAVVAIGFGRGFLPGAPPPARPHTPLVLMHAAVFASWILFFAFQTGLASSGLVRAHRRLGVAGGALAALMLIQGFAVAVQGARTGYSPIPGVDALSFFMVPIGDLVVFAMLVGAAIYWRRTPAVHKRLMWLATVQLLFPAIARLPGVQGNTPVLRVVFLAVLAFAPIYDRIVNGRVNRVSLWGSVAVFLTLPIRHAIAETGAWHSFAAWLIQC